VGSEQHSLIAMTLGAQIHISGRTLNIAQW
jgi:hypothetical protein